jgi:hypothetical protein
MPFFYGRKESQEDIVIVFKYWPAFYIILLLGILGVPLLKLDPKWNFLISTVMIVFLIVWILGHHKANKEVRKAMKNGKVEVSGSKFSFKNPMTFRMKK